MSFNWETEDSAEWDRRPPPPPQRGRRRTLAFWLLLGLLLALGGLAAYRAATERVDTVSAAVRDDVLGSHRLLQQAVASADAEIFDDLLSGQRREWTNAQRQLFARGELADRTPFGLTAVTGPGEVVDVLLSPDLEEAEVIVARSFVLTDTAGLSRTVSLEQAELYRRGATRWLLAPPTDEAWTTWNSLSGARLDLTFVTRDRDLAERLLQDLDRDLALLCASGIQCQEGLRLRLQLDPDPAALLQSAPLAAYLTRRDPLIAPSPSLIGRPQDEDGYQALRRAYAARVVAGALTRALEYDCCDRALVIAALLALHLHDLGLAPPPVSDAAYHRALRQGTELGDLYRSVAAYWIRRLAPTQAEDGTWQALLLLQFMLDRRPDLGPGDLYRGLSGAREFGGWAGRFVGGLADADMGPELQAAWLGDLTRRAGISTDVGEGLLGDNLLALCLPAETSEGAAASDGALAIPDFPHALYAYDDRSRELMRVSDETYTSLLPLPAASGPLLLRLDQADAFPGPSPQQSLVNWGDGSSRLVYTLPPRTATSVQSLAPDGQAITLDSIPIAAGRANRTLLLDLGACATGGCSPQELPAARAAQWSPDSQQLLLLSSDRTVWLVSRGGRARAISGETVYAINWEDDQHVLLYQLPGNARIRGSLERLTLASGQRERLVDEDALRDVLGVGAGDRVEVLFLARLAAPDDRILLVAQTRPSERYNISFVWFDLESRQLTRWMRFERTLFDQRAALHVPRDGGALAVMLSPFNVPHGEMLWLSLDETGMSQRTFVKNWFTAGAYAWSADGEWLAVPRGHYIYLTAPRLGEERVLVHGLPNCSRVAWEGNG